MGILCVDYPALDVEKNVPDLLPQALAAGGDITQTIPITLENPLDRINTIDELLVAILNIFIIIMIPIIILFIMLAGLRYVTARGNSEEIKKATNALIYAIIGAVLILGAVAIAEIIKNTVEQF